VAASFDILRLAAASRFIALNCRAAKVDGPFVPPDRLLACQFAKIMKSITRIFHYPIRRSVRLGLIPILFATVSLSAADQKTDRVIRWSEDKPECALAASDGMHRYSTSYETLKVTLAVDDNELKKTDRTAEHLFSVLVTVNNHGTQAIRIYPGEIKLELVQHHHITARAEEPDDLAHRIQLDSDETIHQSEKMLKKHPEKKESLEYRLKANVELVARWEEFLSTQALRDTTVDSGRPEVTGWIFFSTKSKWFGGWKQEENFVLRIPVGKHIFEFPFKLPIGEIPKLQKRGPS
jgi:hypothetical protein